jgi:hypothetical protein
VYSFLTFRKFPNRTHVLRNAISAAFGYVYTAEGEARRTFRGRHCKQGEEDV